MLKYSIRRILYMFPILFGIILVTFILFNVAGGDPALQVAGKNASPERIAEIREQMGLNKSLPLQFVDYFKQSITFDFGRSWSSKQNILKMMGEGIGPSFSLSAPMFITQLVLAISFSLLLIPFRRTRFDKVVMIICLVGMSVSSLAYIIAFQYFFGYKLGVFPISGWDPSLLGRWEFLTLPIGIGVIYSLGGGLLFFRTIFFDEVNQDYIRTAKAKGLSSKKVLFKHLLRNALIPIITVTVINIPTLILGSLLLENFFGIPGVGNMLVQAINNSDLPVIKAFVFIMSIAYMIFQLITDLLYALADPRVQLR